ncbi:MULTISPECIES: hypothetical protein [Loigolactobacillus]|uniref:Uncharacterized protein n=1 Tax=Loigolactobacillus backii TaxID=375175 RepID=A0A192H193_9LACO|nr:MULTISPECIES: hypothetical protein [Loigolactobacillus]ANK60515.1 hypothetical protein AYR52_09790 [Loigolactobacillus backii]ANK62012.1 hypothetical protein AYR53_04060 [Loigolactobacillus backii]ANK65371.1 hypothetical protein AYR54_09055 [Loigolactobacillus backii]ANK67919.1 hypothetical protein AYR55_09590 [Loigolactobacillus backii]ANK68794.1 hypothetical protein AYR56_00665 [Loigolactobacillus backii]
MLLDDGKTIKNIIAAKIVKVAYPKVIAQDELGELITINTSEKQQDDPLFWESLKNILHAQLWVPVGRHFHQLLALDWIAPVAE